MQMVRHQLFNYAAMFLIDAYCSQFMPGNRVPRSTMHPCSSSSYTKCKPSCFSALECFILAASNRPKLCGGVIVCLDQALTACGTDGAAPPVTKHIVVSQVEPRVVDINWLVQQQQLPPELANGLCCVAPYLHTQVSLDYSRHAFLVLSWFVTSHPESFCLSWFCQFESLSTVTCCWFESTDSSILAYQSGKQINVGICQGKCHYGCSPGTWSCLTWRPVWVNMMTAVHGLEGHEKAWV